MAAGQYVLYEHVNKLNSKRYIGVTNNTTKRWYGKGKHYDGCPAFWAQYKSMAGTTSNTLF